MKTFRYAFILLAFAALFSSCADENSISGKIEGGQNMNLQFDQTSFDRTTVLISQCKIDDTGNFKLLMPENIEPGMYRLRIGAKSIDFIFDGSERQVVLDANLNTIAQLDYTITGAPMTEEYTSVFRKLMTKELNANQIKEYIKGDASPLAAVMLAYKTFQLRANYVDIHKSALEKLNKSSLVGQPLAVKFGGIVSALESQQKRQQGGSKIKVGQPAPEIAMKNPHGKTYKLSELKGQVVLIDFWASWCGPCRKANPHVVSVYDQFKNQGFTVFSVSLDGLDTRAKKRYGNDQSKINAGIATSKQKWASAIEKDNLKWEYHVSDLKKWESLAAAEYGVRNIPQTFLVDRDGNIAAVNPRNGLEQQVQKLL